MCLHPRSNIKTSNADLTVYKVFLMKDGAYYSPYRRTKWKVGETKTVASFGDARGYKGRFKKRLPEGGIVIGRGLHAYEEKKYAKRRQRNVKIVRCTIPAGTPYILGAGHEIVSLSLRFDAVVSKRVEPF